MDDERLVKQCLKGKRSAQKHFYERFSEKMFGVCLRYVKQHDAAQDVLQDGFIKVFQNLQKYNNKGSLEGWVRRVIVNTALDYLRKEKTKGYSVQVEDVSYRLEKNDFIIERLSANDLLKIIHTLPEGYKTVFNMYAIEGYSHKEIAAKLDISENTSKSQYSRAKAQIRDLLEKIETIER